MMKTFKAYLLSDSQIILENPSELNELWDILEGNENFILVFPKEDNGGEKISKVMISSDLLPKIKNSEISLSAVGEEK